MTRVSTSFGEVPASVLRERDPVRTQNGEILRIQWLDRVTLSEDFMARHPQAAPILIPAGAFKPGLPQQDILISPAQRITIQDTLACKDLRAASSLTSMPRISRKPQAMLTYTMFHLGRPANVRTEGLWAETKP